MNACTSLDANAFKESLLTLKLISELSKYHHLWTDVNISPVMQEIMVII